MTASRDLGGKVSTLSQLSVASCAQLCAQNGYPYAGIQEGINCFCGDSYGQYGASSGKSHPCYVTTTLHDASIRLILIQCAYFLGLYFKQVFNYSIFLSLMQMWTDCNFTCGSDECGGLLSNSVYYAVDVGKFVTNIRV